MMDLSTVDGATDLGTCSDNIFGQIAAEVFAAGGGLYCVLFGYDFTPWGGTLRLRQFHSISRWRFAMR
jgi:hypothetical protein